MTLELTPPQLKALMTFVATATGRGYGHVDPVTGVTTTPEELLPLLVDAVIALAHNPAKRRRKRT